MPKLCGLCKEKITLIAIISGRTPTLPADAQVLQLVGDLLEVLAQVVRRRCIEVAAAIGGAALVAAERRCVAEIEGHRIDDDAQRRHLAADFFERSEERRVGKEWVLYV